MVVALGQVHTLRLPHAFSFHGKLEKESFRVRPHVALQIANDVTFYRQSRAAVGSPHGGMAATATCGLTLTASIARLLNCNCFVEQLRSCTPVRSQLGFYTPKSVVYIAFVLQL